MDVQDEADIVRSYEELRALRDIAVFQLMKERGQLPVQAKDKERKASKDEIGPGTMKTLEKASACNDDSFLLSSRLLCGG